MKVPTIKRSCDGCTACCQGWLSAQIYGRDMPEGRPCHFVGKKGCSIYKDRPEDPCVGFKCEWLKDDGTLFPEWLKPELAKVIILRLGWGNGQEFIQVKECGEPISSKVLNWLYVFGAQTGIPMQIQVAGTWNKLGPPEFMAANTL